MHVQKFLCALLLGVVSLLTSYQPPQAHADQQTIFQSTFEDGLQGWNNLPGVTSLDSSISHNGVQSLRFTNNNPADYKMFNRKLTAQDGEMLHISAWIKGQSITSSKNDQGAGVFVEAYNAQGKWLDGAYSPTLHGNFDWQNVKTKFTVPPSTATLTLGLYLRNGTTGTAWFDDVVVTAEMLQPIQGLLTYPNYRGLIPARDSKPWQAEFNIHALPQWKNKAISLKSTLLDVQGKVLFTETVSIPPETSHYSAKITPPATSENHSYRWVLSFLDSSDTEIKTFDYDITVVPQMPKVYIDDAGFTVVNGSRFFPLGLYTDGQTADQASLKRIANAGFNTVLNYAYGSQLQNRQEYMDLAERNGLKVLFSLKDFYKGLPYAPKVDDPTTLAMDYIKELRSKPALLGWYINDERPPDWIPRLQQMYDQIKTLDADHLAYQVLYQTGGLAQYFSSTDVIGTDPYPVGETSDLTRTGIATNLVRQNARNAKGVWMVPQIFDWAVYQKSKKTHQPTRDEMRNQAYQAIINGAQGLIFYSDFDLRFTDANRKPDEATFQKRWVDVAAMAQEIHALIPTILQGKDIAVQNANSRVEARVLKDANELVILLANPYYEEAHTTLTLPSGWKISPKEDNFKSTLEGNTLTITLPPIGSGSLRLHK